MIQLKGIITPIVTPMKANEDLDLARLEELIEHLIECGVHGIFVLGTTGEFYALSDDEKQQVMGAAVRVVRGRVPVLAGIGAESTVEVIRLAKMAEKEKVDAVSVITPYFITPSQNEIADHFRRIAEKTALPIVLYSNPSTTGGIKIEPTTVARLSEIKNIIGIKDSSGDLTLFLETLALTHKDFAVLTGRDTLIYSSLQLGGKGAVPGISNFVAKPLVELYRAFQNGDFNKALELQNRLAPLRQGMTLSTPPGPVKIAMDLLGMSAGPSRSPISPMSSAKLDQLKEKLIAAGLKIAKS